MVLSPTIGVIAEAFDSGYHTPLFGALHHDLQALGGRLVFVQGTPEDVVQTGIATDEIDG